LQTVRQSVIVRFRDVTPEDFLYSYRKNFVKAVKSALNVRLKDVVIVSLQPAAVASPVQRAKGRPKRAAYGLDVLVAARAPTGGYVPAAAVARALNNNLEELELTTGLTVSEVLHKKCTPSYCKYGECVDKVVVDKTQLISVNTELTSFVAPAHHHKVLCQCKEGYDGEFICSNFYYTI